MGGALLSGRSGSMSHIYSLSENPACWERTCSKNILNNLLQSSLLTVFMCDASLTRTHDSYFPRRVAGLKETDSQRIQVWIEEGTASDQDFTLTPKQHGSVSVCECL